MRDDLKTDGRSQPRQATHAAPGPTASDFADGAKALDILIGCDSEFEGAHTLTAQLAARVGGRITVLVYHTPALPGLPAIRPGDVLTDDEQARLGKLRLLPHRPITADLSPARIVAGLFGLRDAEAVPRAAGMREWAEEGARARPITLTLAAHHWPADFFRVFGAEFLNSMLLPRDGSTALAVRAHKTLSFEAPGGGRFAAPVLEYLRVGGVLRPVHVKHLDTNHPFGPASLDAHAKTFTGLGKKEPALTKDELAHMLETFHARPRKVLAYATRDAVLALLLAERMREEDRRMYVSLGFPEGDTPAMRHTLGSRAAEMVMRTAARHAEGSARLSAGGPAPDKPFGGVSLARIKTLFRGGSGGHLSDPSVSRFGAQTGETHGGLLFTRSPTRFFHAAPGQLADVDMSGCYLSILKGMSIYIGRPVVFEPGSRRMPLRDAVRMLEEHAAGPDAWMVKVTGDITSMPNVLIPSTNSALTHANFKKRAAKALAKTKDDRASRRRGDEKASRGSTLYTHRVEAGVVTRATWLMIQAMPERVRKEYEALEAETIILYPKRLVADHGEAFDALCAELEREGPHWSSRLDMGRLLLKAEERLDDRYVSLRFPISGLAGEIAGFRRQAREDGGKGSGMDLAWKQLGNTMYGVLSSRHLAANNIVAANVITATGRALAFAMQMSLNGLQVITDGNTCRRDQVPAGTFADCLEAYADYPVDRSGYAGPFIPARDTPQDDKKFSPWYRGHVMRFFGVAGADYERLFGLHQLEHKTAGGRATFDAICLDGPANYIKLAEGAGGWEELEFKARGFGKEAKSALKKWIIDTYSQDLYEEPPPVTESRGLMGYEDALGKARGVLTRPSPGGESAGDAEAWVPLGQERRSPQTYKVIRGGQFLYRSPAQHRNALKALGKFSAANGCGPESLTLRRGYDGRRQGSLADLASAMFDFIRRGGDNITRAFNLTRGSVGQDAATGGLAERLEALRREASARLRGRLAATNMPPEARLTGLFIIPADIDRLRSRGDG